MFQTQHFAINSFNVALMTSTLLESQLSTADSHEISSLNRKTCMWQREQYVIILDIPSTQFYYYYYYFKSSCFALQKPNGSQNK